MATYSPFAQVLHGDGAPQGPADDDGRRLETLLDDYLIDCRVRRLRASTIDGEYAPRIRRQFLPWARANGITRPEQITRTVLNRWSLHLAEQPGKYPGTTMSPGTVRIYVGVVNGWLSWMLREGVVDQHIKGHRPKVSKPLIEVLSPAEVQRLVEAAACDRDRLIIELLWETGCRVGELCGLELDDLVIGRGERHLRIRTKENGGGGKGHHDRLVPIPGCYPKLRRYLQSQRPRCSASTVFVSLHRQPSGEYEPLNPNAVALLVKKAATHAGIGRRVHPHLIRHSAATWWLKCGMDSLTAARILGHTNLTMLFTTYAHLASADLYDAAVRVQQGDRQRRRDR
jgi:integrase/recombinase XerD